MSQSIFNRLYTCAYCGGKFVVLFSSLHRCQYRFLRKA